MRFCDKLPKLRKDNNLSQEQLADRLGVSRQAVSKWESGSSYPDMDKMIQMCSILNCTLEDLLDDGTIGNSNLGSKSNVNNYFQDFLKFVTKIYNMFCSMSFKQKMKCLFEMAIIFFVLFALSSIILSVLESLVFNFLLNIPNVGRFFYEIINNILVVLLVAIGCIIFIHLFKIRYLDYYITIEDACAHEKTIEEPIDKPKEIYREERKQEKIIIRDPKHSSFSFFNFLLKIVMFFLKAFCLFISVFVIMSFLFLIVMLFISVYHLGYGILFGWISLALIGCILINYNFLEIIYKFIVCKKQATKRLFIVFIVGLILIGSGIGLSITNVMSFDEITNFATNDYTLSYEEIEMKEDMVLDFYTEYDNVKYVIDNSVSNIKLEIRHLNNMNYSLIEHDSYVYVTWDINFKDAYDMILNDLKNKVIRDYDSGDYMYVTVTISEDNYNKLNSNCKNYDY